MATQDAPQRQPDDHPTYDLLVVGGGINGTGIARDAAGRGLRVLLCERGDLAQGTSSRSSGLVHGGLRYLEYGALRLVREALHEREVLMRLAPHLVRPLEFLLPHAPGMRPAWVLRLGLLLYDHLARRHALPASRAVRCSQLPEGAALRPHLRRGFCYFDCRTDDARLVLANAVGARELGAHVLPRTELLGAHARHGLWEASLRESGGGATRTACARVIVNAAGPWVAEVGARLPGAGVRHGLRLVKGSHIIVPRFWEGERAFLLQNPDGRVIFVLPLEQRFALVGTTDMPCAHAPVEPRIDEEEAAYLCAAVNAQLRCTLTPRDALHSYAGVRCLVDDARTDGNPAALSRDYVLDLDTTPGRPPVLSVLGGKLTTFRRLAEHALDRLAEVLPGMGGAWTAQGAPLPGAEFKEPDPAAARAAFLRDTGFVPTEHAAALWDRHGARARAVIGSARTASGLGQHFGAGLYACELEYLHAQEWALTADDVLWRRTKFGLHLDAEQVRAVGSWMD